MAQFALNINGKTINVDADEDKPLLWVIREDAGLNGTKFGCGIARCGTCTILVDGNPVRSCVTPVASAEGKEITTIEGLSEDNSHPVQQAWIAEQVPQCGYCQAGQMMSAVALLNENPDPSDEDINQAMRGNLCRCGTYQRIKKAIHTAAKNL